MRMGRETGVPTPINQFIYASLLLQEARNRLADLRYNKP
ncbi:MAG: hypothetical protein IPK17_20375 [Chloroflexi bacterium]|nr:hypothetical protein [Chloroflexota bacterium]